MMSMSGYEYARIMLSLSAWIFMLVYVYLKSYMIKTQNTGNAYIRFLFCRYCHRFCTHRSLLSWQTFSTSTVGDMYVASRFCYVNVNTAHSRMTRVISHSRPGCDLVSMHCFRKRLDSNLPRSVLPCWGMNMEGHMRDLENQYHKCHSHNAARKDWFSGQMGEYSYTIVDWVTKTKD